MIQAVSKNTGRILQTMARASSTVAPLPDRVYLFNYFEKPPIDDSLFKDVWCKGGDHVKKSDEFVSTHLHSNKDPNAKFPWINFAIARSPKVTFLNPDDWWKNYMVEVQQHKLVACPAGYREIGSYKGNALVADDKMPPSDSSRFFITAVKVGQGISEDDLESNWKEWTGADFLHGKIETSNIGDSHFYKRFMMAPKFQYTVRTEVNNMDDATGHEIAKAANERAGKEGVETITGFCNVEISVKKA
uniref:uncharacterized protein LOC100185071 n=1 Tax=Ciona intestinalis TaxID=7719 RepID=UPI000180D1DB|nr:uncharacterized protein LOC100185071 [Ciona intestinalis]|eukprot:XP_002122067.1 uncharacterized protein LOC100185071 [Ciona intestinalis]